MFDREFFILVSWLVMLFLVPGCKYNASRIDKNFVVGFFVILEFRVDILTAIHITIFCTKYIWHLARKNIIVQE